MTCIPSWQEMRNLVYRHDMLCLRLDGSGLLDKISLIKFIAPKTRLVWELHGFREENYTSLAVRTALDVLWFRFKRFFLSMLVDKYIFISDALAHHAHMLLWKKPHVVIPNFVDNEVTFYASKPLQRQTIKSLVQSHGFVVLWGGSATYPWHALDIIAKVAEYIFRIDKKVLFLIIGSRPWYRYPYQPNITLLNTLPSELFQSVVKRANVCLALYRKTKLHPLYFSPLKMLDYMQLGKPTISTTEIARHMGIVDGVHGYSSANNAHDIAKKILFLKRHPKTARLMGKRAKRLVQTTRNTNQAAEKYREFLTRTI